MVPTKVLAYALFAELEADIRDRKGIGSEWDAIDSAVMYEEVKPAITKIFHSWLRKAQEIQMEQDCIELCFWCRNSGQKYQGYIIQSAAFEYNGVFHTLKPGRWEYDGKPQKCDADLLRIAWADRTE